MQLTAEEARVVGSLVEKQLATPKYYPLTLHALMAACNQLNNRDPVVSYDAETVEAAIAGLRSKGFVRLIHAGGGSRVQKYRHVLDEVLGLDQRELAIVGLLLLRGPQTVGELRGRSERMATFDDLGQVQHDLERLRDREEPLVELQPRAPGQKESRWATTLTPTVVAPATATSSTPPARTAGRSRRPRTPRIEPLPEDAWDDDAAELLRGVQGTAARAGASNIFTTLVRHRSLMRRWLPFGGKLLAGALPARLRELAILRTAWNCGSDYEWGHHVTIGRASGLDDEEIERVAAGPDGGWDEVEAAVLRAADELHEAACISDATWSVLVGHLDERQLIEVPFVVGHYHLVAFALNSLGVQPEDGLAPLPPAP